MIAKPVLEMLLVDDDVELRTDMASYFSRHGHVVEQCGRGEDALGLAERRPFDVMVLDLKMSGISGLDVLKELQARNAEGEVVVLTGEATVEAAVEAMKLGAREFLVKPISLKELDRLVRKAYETGQLRKENRQLKAALRYHQTPPQIIGQSEPMQEMCRLIARVAPTDKPILIQGESGTGKELVARALHEASPIADKPIVVINCAALPETLLESELFGSGILIRMSSQRWNDTAGLVTYDSFRMHWTAQRFSPTTIEFGLRIYRRKSLRVPVQSRRLLPATSIWTSLRTITSWKRTSGTRAIRPEPPERLASGGGLSIDSWKNIILRLPNRTGRRCEPRATIAIRNYLAHWKMSLCVNGQLNAMITKIEEILSAKNESGKNAYLWLQSAAGDCILWPTEDASENEDSADAIGRWQLTVDEANALIETGEVDEVE
jgi:ActR/RegA family two-component response regulator